MALAPAYPTKRDWLGMMPPAFTADTGATLDLDFVGATRLPSYVTFTRSSSGTYFGPDGLMKVSACNLCLQSADFSTTWGRTNISAFGSGSVVNDIAAPDGTTTADFVREDAGSGTHTMQQASITCVSGDVYCFSVYVKAGGRGFAHVGFSTSTAFTTLTTVTVNLTTGAVTSGTGAPLSSGSSDAGNGWWRVYIRLAAVAAGAGTVIIYTSVDGVWANRSYAGDSTSGIYLWGAQLEAGVTTPSPYIPTTTAAASLPRFTHDPTTRAPKGLLIEGARTNLLVNSVLAGGASPTSWSLLLNTGSRAVATSIYGTADGGAALQFTGAATRYVLGEDITIASNTTYAYSVFVEATDGTAVNQDVLYASGLPSGCSITAWYANGVASSSGATLVTGTLTLIIGGTYTGAGGTSFRIGIGCNGNATGIVTLSRPQLEAGSMRSTFIPTTTGTVARSADLAVITGTEATSRIGATAGTLIVEWTAEGGIGSLGGARAIASLDDGSANNYVKLYQSGGSPTGEVVSGGAAAGYSQAVGTAAVVGTVTRTAIRYVVDDCRFARDGTLGTADSAPTALPVTIDHIYLGAQYGGSQGHLCLRRVILFASDLGDTATNRVTDSTKVSSRALVSGLWNTGATAGVMMPAHWQGSPL